MINNKNNNDQLTKDCKNTKTINIINDNNKSHKKKENTKEERRHTGTGVLIITEYLGEPHILLGQENWKTLDYSTVCPGLKLPIYEEFGGGIQTRKVSLEKNAIFELREETANLFNFTNPDLLRKCPYYDIPFKEDRMYRIYLLYLQNIGDYLHYFYINVNSINTNIKKGLTSEKSANYLEMNNIKLLPLKLFYNVVKKPENYICFKDFETEHNKSKNKSFKGILRLTDDIYINSRLMQFLNSRYNGIYGLDLLNNYYRSCNIKASFKNYKSIKIKGLRVNNKQFNDKYRFLIGTYSIDIYI
jgi:hypothetical protein